MHLSCGLDILKEHESVRPVPTSCLIEYEDKNQNGFYEFSYGDRHHMYIVSGGFWGGGVAPMKIPFSAFRVRQNHRISTMQE